MKNKTLNIIKEDVIQKLQESYSYCSVTDRDNMVIINSTDENDKDINITIKIDN